MKSFLKDNHHILLGVASLVATQLVNNFDFWIYILVLLATYIIILTNSKRASSVIFIAIIAMSVFAFFTIGTAKHRYLVTYENGTMICADGKKEISNKCLTDRSENLGAYVKHEYIGKAFYK